MIVYRLEAHPDGENWTVLFFSDKCHANRAYADVCRNTHWDVYLDSQIVPSGREPTQSGVLHRLGGSCAFSLEPLYQP